MNLKCWFYYSQSFTYICMMSFFKKTLDFYIYSNLHIAVSAFCLVKITLLTNGVEENKTPLFVFLSTIVAYNFIRFYRMSDIVNWFTEWMDEYKNILYILFALSIISAGFLAIQFQLKAFLHLIPFALLTFFYAFPLPLKNIPLRNVPGIKLFVIGLSFAGVTVIFPLVQNDITLAINHWLTFIQRFLFIVLITIPFDIRDLHCDIESLNTLPQKFGVKRAKTIGVFYAVFFIVLDFFKQPIDEIQLIIGLIVIVVSAIFLIFSKENQSKYFSAFWVESLPIFWFLLIFLGLNL